MPGEIKERLKAHSFSESFRAQMNRCLEPLGKKEFRQLRVGVAELEQQRREALALACREQPPDVLFVATNFLKAESA